MKNVTFAQLLLLSLATIFFSGCGQLFEHSSDMQAKKALEDLMVIQETFHKDNKRYAKNFTELEKYNLEYHRGIVYLEIQSATEKAYRAISLPAESITARVFAYDTGKGGYYEMEEEEVSEYVLGALNFIRKTQREHQLITLSSTIMLVAMVFLGVRIAFRFMGEKNRSAFGSFFLSLLPLIWVTQVLSFLTPDVYISSTITMLSGVSVVASIVAFIWGTIWLIKRTSGEEEPTVLGLFGITVVASIFSLVVMAQTYTKFY
jgi:hypothetical protein